METVASGPRLVRFGAFQLDVTTGELRKNGVLLKLRPQAAKALLLLATHPDETVTRDQLKREIWGTGFFVDFEHSLNVCMGQIRVALGDQAEKPRCIETVPRLGYRFIARVEEVVAEPRTSPQTNTAVGAGDSEMTHNAPAANTLRPWRRRSWLAGGLVLAAVAVVIGSIAYGSLSEWLLRKEHAGRIRSIAVLPLANLSGDTDQEYFAEGMTDELITDLANIHSLRVISRNSVMQYKDKVKPTPQIARELNVDATVEGTVTRSGDRVRITARLISAPDDQLLWAETYERNLRDILILQDEVAKAIAREIRITLTSPELARLSDARTVDPTAHQDYLRGMYELHGLAAEPAEALRFQSIQRAIAYFQQALSQDPSDALAYAGLASAYSDLSTHYSAPLEVMPKAKAAARKAIDLDETLAEAHASLGYVALSFDWDWSSAEREFRKALDLDPSLAAAHAGYAQCLLFAGDHTDEWLKEMQQAYALDPLLPQGHGDISWFLFLARRYSESIKAARRNGNDSVLALSYAELGRPAEAVAAADRAAQSTQSPLIQGNLAAAYALAGRKDKALAILGGIEAEAQGQYICGFTMACLYSVLGVKERALAWLERAIRERSD